MPRITQIKLDIFKLEWCGVYNFMKGFSIDLDAVNSFSLWVCLLRYFEMILFVQLIVVVLAVVGVSIDMVADVEVFVFVYINSWNAATIFIERFPIWLWCCGHMKQAVPCTRQVLVDNYVIFNFEFITPIRDGPDMVTFCQGYIAIDGEDVFWKGFSWSVD